MIASIWNASKYDSSTILLRTIVKLQKNKNIFSWLLSKFRADFDTCTIFDELTIKIVHILYIILIDWQQYSNMTYCGCACRNGHISCYGEIIYTIRKFNIHILWKTKKLPFDELFYCFPNRSTFRHFISSASYTRNNIVSYILYSIHIIVRYTFS